MHDRRIVYFNRLSDRELVELLLANDEEAVEYVFFHRCDGMFSHVISSVYQSQVKKEELITEFYLFLSADNWQRLRQFEFKAALNTWLTLVAVRFFKEKKNDFLGKNEASDPWSGDDMEKVSDSYDLVHEVSKHELYEAIEQIPKPRERYALLGVLTGKRAETIAQELGCSVAAVYNLTKRARKALLKRMKGKEQ